MPDKALDQDLVAAIRKITDRFITSRDGTPKHISKRELGKKHDLLEQAVRDGYLQDIGPRYFPCFQALEFEDPDSRFSVEKCITLVFKGLRAIYEREGDKMCTCDDILQACKEFDTSASHECVSAGMLFATNFSSYIPQWGASPDNEKLSLNLQTSARLLEFDDVPSAWKREVTRRPHATEQVFAPLGGPSNPGPAPHTSQPESILIFLSHAAKDQDIAIYLKKIIEEAIPGSKVFVSSDTEDLRPGDEWVKTIRQNLREAKMLLLLATKRGLARPWVWYETGSAWSREIRMIPCCLGNMRKSGLSAPFSSYQALNADEAGDFKNLLTEIGRELGLPVRLPKMESVVSQLQALERAAHESNAGKTETDPIRHGVVQLEGEIERLAVENRKLKIRPYDDAQRQSAQSKLRTYSDTERDLLRFLIQRGETEGSLIYKVSQDGNDFCTRALERLGSDGMIQMREDMSQPNVWRPRYYRVNPIFEPILRDLLYPRQEAQATPRFII